MHRYGSPELPALPRDFARRAGGCLFITTLVLTLLFGLGGLLFAQDSTADPASKPQLGIFADTAGVAAIGTGVYVTWVFAKATPEGLPSSGVLVAFDCGKRLVKRLAQVKYRLRADSAGVEGDVQEVQREWQEPVVPRLFDLICMTGAAHDVLDPPPPPNPKPWHDPKDHRV